MIENKPTERNKTRMLALTALFAALTAMGAFIQIPVPPAPISLQFMFTAMAGCLLGGRWGAVSQLVYVIIGLAGVPVFTAGGGIGYVFHPTFGFLIGFVAAAFVIGVLKKRTGKGFLSFCIPILAGVFVLYLIGVPYMYIILRFYMGNQIGFLPLLWSSMIVFLPGEAVKVASAAFLCSKMLPRLEAITQK